MKHVVRWFALVMVMALAVPPATAQTVPDCGPDPVQPPAPVDPGLFGDDAFATPIGTYKTDGFDGSGAEIVAFDADTARIFTVNSVTERVDVIDASDPSAPALVGCLALDGPPTSVAVLKGGFAAVAYQVDPKTDPGLVVVVNRDGLLAAGPVEVGPAVDALIATAGGTRLLAANEGEIPDDYSGDPAEIPEGSVSVIEVPDDPAALTQGDVTTIGFDGLADLVAADPDIRRAPSTEIPTYQQDFEPEFVAVDETTGTAYVSLQESSAIAVLDLATLEFTGVFGLPVVDHSRSGGFLSPSDEPFGGDPLDAADASVPDAAFADPDNTGRAAWPVVGMPMPDGIAVMTAESGTTYVLTAEEGDGREWGENPAETFNYLDEARVEDLAEEGLLCPGALSDDELAALGRLTVSRFDGFDQGGTCIERLHAYGTRGMGVYDAGTGDRVWHSGDDFEQLGLEAHPRFFNSDHAEAAYLNRSDNKGPEPEYVELGEIGDRTYAFVGLERISALAVYDVTDPTAPELLDYLYNRDFAAQLEDLEDPLAGDLGPEGLDFVPAEDSPTRRPLLVVGNEVSGTTTIWQVNVDPLPPPAAVVRVSGAGRVETAIEVSRARFETGTAGAVVLARADVFADALSGTPRAVAEDAPLLLTPSDSLDESVTAEILRVLPETGTPTVFLLDGEVALDGAVEASLAAAGVTPVRLAGVNRFATAAVIAGEGLDDPATVLLADGGDFPDAVVAGPAAGHVGGAVLLTDGDVQAPETAAYLASASPETVAAVGGAAAAAAPDADALVGATRFETAVLVAESFFADPPVVGIATGLDFADALAGGAQVGAAGGPLVLTEQDRLTGSAAAYLETVAGGLTTAYLYGGTEALSPTVADAVRGILDG